MWVTLWIVFRRVDWEAAKLIWPNIFVNSPRPEPLRERFLIGDGSLLKLPFLCEFHLDLCPVFPRCSDAICKALMHVCMQAEPKKEAYHNLYNTLVLIFDQLLSEVHGKAEIVPLVVRSGLRNHSNRATVQMED